MGKYRQKIKPTEQGLQNAAEEERRRADEIACEHARAAEEKRQEMRSKTVAAIVFYTAALALFVLSVVFFGLNVARMRDYELHYERTQATVIDHDTRGGFGKAYFVLVLSYSYDGYDYLLRDTRPFRGVLEEAYGKQMPVYVDPQNPARAATVWSADEFSVVGAVLFAFSSVLFLAIARFLRGPKTFARRALCAYLPIAVMGAAFTLLFLVGLPLGGALFSRVRGAAGYIVVSGLALLLAVADGLISRKLKKIML